MLRRRENDGPHADKAVNDAFDNADKTYDFYRDRSSLRPEPISEFVSRHRMAGQRP